MSVHSLAILPAKIAIFYRTAKSRFTSFNGGFQTEEIAKTPLGANRSPEADKRQL
jgi:hypothetical protein